MRRLLCQLAWVLSAATCGCGEDVMQFGRSEPPTELAVESLLLRYAATGQVILDLSAEIPLSIAQLEATDVSLEAVAVGNVGSVEFVVDGDAKTEHVPPFTYPGDTEGRLSAFTATVGEHTVVATPYTLLDAQGQRGIPLSRAFTFVK